MKIKVNSKMSRLPGFELLRDFYMIKTWFKFEGNIPNDPKVIVFTRNHTDDGAGNDNDAYDDKETKQNMPPPVEWGRGRHKSCKS